MIKKYAKLYLICYLIPYIIIGFQLISIHDLSEALTYISNPILNMTYLSKIAISLLSMSSFQILKIIAVILNQVNIFDLIAIVIFIYYFTYKYFGIVIMELLIMVFSIMIALTYGNVANAMMALKLVGSLFILFQGSMILYCLITLFKRKKAL